MEKTVEQFYRLNAQDGRAVLQWRKTATGCKEPLLWIVWLRRGCYAVVDDVVVPRTRARAGYVAMTTGDAFISAAKRDWRVHRNRVRDERRRRRRLASQDARAVA